MPTRSRRSPTSRCRSRAVSRAGTGRGSVVDAHLDPEALHPVVALLGPGAVLEALDLADGVGGPVVHHADAELAPVAFPARDPEEVVGAVGGERRVLVHLRVRVVEP